MDIKNDKGKVLIIVFGAAFLVSVIISLVAYVIMDGIIGTVTKFFSEIGELVLKTENFFSKKKVNAAMDTYVIKDEEVQNLKTLLENSGINTQKSGLTEIRLRKILLANAVSTSLSHTLCTAPITEEQMLANLKEKEYGKDFESIDDFITYCEESESRAEGEYKNVTVKESKDVWPIDDPEYKLYYDSDKFFYFQDTELVLEGTDSNQWYLGAMGATEIIAESGEAVKHVDAAGFAQAKANFEDFAKKNLDDPEKVIGSKQTRELLGVYTDGETQGTIKVYTLNSYVRKYDYIFNKGAEKNYYTEFDCRNDETEFNVQETTIDLSKKLNMNEYEISIQLMIDLLDMTASGQFLEEFIDFALAKTGAKAKAYSTLATNYRYDKKTYDIKEDVILELYDIVEAGVGLLADNGNDNFKAYKSVIYNRLFVVPIIEEVTINTSNGTNTGNTNSAGGILDSILNSIIQGLLGDDNTNNNNDSNNNSNNSSNDSNNNSNNNNNTTQQTVQMITGYFTSNKLRVDEFLKDYKAAQGKDYDRDGETYEGGKYQVPPLKKLLKTAYETYNADIDVIEGIIEITEETSWDVQPSEVKTWYSTTTYPDPEIITKYYVSNEAGEVDKSVFDAYNYIEDTSQGVKQTLPDETITDVYISALHNLEVIAPPDKVYENRHVDTGQDLIDDVLNKKPGEANEANFWYCTIKGLKKVAENDGGEFNNNLGPGSGCDYVLSSYTVTNVKEYNQTTKTSIESLDTSNIREKIDVSIDTDFLELLKNKDGEIPESPGSEGGFLKEGKVVLYDDIYEGHSPAGDLLLDNGALMLFELLESNPKTQSLVNIFKYYAYLYTGVDYGITDEAQLVDIFKMQGLSFITSGGGNGFWWPIGSSTTTTENGKLFAKGMPVDTYISSGVGPRWGTNHGGIDITGCPSGTYIIASKAGTVIEATDGFGDGFLGSLDNGGYGNLVIIQHADGMYTYYAHLLKGTIKVKVGETVEQGQVIGGMGTSGNSTGTHLHFEVRDSNGTRLDPEQYVSESNPRPTGGGVAQDQTVTYGGKTIKYDDTFARQPNAPTSNMIERTITSKTTCYDLCYFCCEKTQSDPYFGVTASGIKLSGGERIVAADTDTIPMGSWIYIEGAGYYMVADVGGAIQGTRIDIFVGLPGDTIGDASGGTAANPGAGQTCWNAPDSYSRVTTSNNAVVHILKEEYWPK